MRIPDAKLSRAQLLWALVRSPMKESRRRHAAGGFHPATRLALFIIAVALIAFGVWPPMRISDAKLAELEALEKALGPACDWHVIHGNEIVDEDGEPIVYAVDEASRRESIAEFVAALRNSASDLLADLRECKHLENEKAQAQNRSEALEAARDRMHAINAMLGHWYEDAYELLKKAGIPDEIESPLGDLADDMRSHLSTWYSGEDFKSVRIYKRMEAERDRYRMALEAVSLRLHGPSHFLGNEVSVIVSAALAKAGAP